MKPFRGIAIAASLLVSVARLLLKSELYWVKAMCRVRPGVQIATGREVKRQPVSPGFLVI